MTSGRRRLAVLALLLPWTACDFQPDPVPGPSPVGPARYVSVTIQYRQPSECINAAQSGCGNVVVFYGSWMKEGQQVYLTSDAGSHIWTGVAPGVPVNWPPTDEPHRVRVFDPHIYDTPTGGVTGARITFGGQMLTTFENPGTTQETALAYVDDDGVGRNPL